MRNIKRISTELKFELTEYDNNGFSRGKCFIAYRDENRNGSYISKKSFEKALHTMYGIPIVGEFLEDSENEINTDMKGNYTDHEGVYNRPSPLGFVPTSATFTWETLEDKKEYLVVNGLILWTKRYPEAKYVLEQKMNQSMEIDLNEKTGGYFSKEDNLYHITDFSFEALTVLGTDRVRNSDGTALYTGKNDTEPCFEGSHFDTYSINNSFKKEYEQMLKEFKQFALTENFNLNTEVEDLAKKNFTLSANQIMDMISDKLSEKKVVRQNYYGESYETNEFWLRDLVVEDKMAIVMDSDCKYSYGIPYKIENESVVLDYESKKHARVGDWVLSSDEKDATESNFSKVVESYVKLTGEQVLEKTKEKAIEDFKADFKVKETEDYKELEKNYTDLESKYAKVETEPNEKLQLEYEDVKKKLDDSNETLGKLQADFNKIEEEKQTLTTNFETLTSDKETLEKDLNEYKVKEKQIKIDELFSKKEFTCLFEEADYKDLKEKSIEVELPTLEEKLYIMLGKFSAKAFSKKEEEKKEDPKIINLGHVFKYESKKEKDEEADYAKKWCK